MAFDYLVGELRKQEMDYQREQLDKRLADRAQDYATWLREKQEQEQEQEQETDRAVAHVQRENEKAHEERWGVREAAAERIRETVRRAESDPETWLAETLEADDDR